MNPIGHNVERTCSPALIADFVQTIRLHRLEIATNKMGSSICVAVTRNELLGSHSEFRE